MDKKILKSEKKLLKLYATLEPAKHLEGEFTGQLPGPTFMLPAKKAFMKLSGLPGWRGKNFFGDYGLNVLEIKGKIQDGPKMTISKQAHKVDSKEGAVATYSKEAPYLWARCTDEFRFMDENTIVGMSYFDLPLLRNMPVPFVLNRKPEIKGSV